jgi:hypothetical protein
LKFRAPGVPRHFAPSRSEIDRAINAASATELEPVGAG